MMPEPKKEQKEKPVLSQNDIDMINELDYEDKKRNKPYNPYERHWDEA